MKIPAILGKGQLGTLAKKGDKYTSCFKQNKIIYVMATIAVSELEYLLPEQVAHI